MFTASRKPGGYGSYGRGTAGVGSDLDLLLILQRCDEPIWNRLRRWDTGSLPLACDLLVYSLEEWRAACRSGIPSSRRRCSTTPAGWGKCRAGGGIAGQIVIKLVHTIHRALPALAPIQPAAAPPAEITQRWPAVAPGTCWGSIR